LGSREGGGGIDQVIRSGGSTSEVEIEQGHLYRWRNTFSRFSRGGSVLSGGRPHLKGGQRGEPEW